MKRIMAGVYKVDTLLYVIAGVMLALMILLTLCDVILRNFGHPITGSLELIQYGGSIVFGFAIPYATWNKAHVRVDLLTEKLSPKYRKIMEVITRCLGIVLFGFIAYNFFIYGMDVKRTGELTASFKIPYYPFVFSISFSCFFQCLTLLSDLMQTIQKGGNNE